jgi:hypothetical protein
MMSYELYDVQTDTVSLCGKSGGGKGAQAQNSLTWLRKAPPQRDTRIKCLQSIPHTQRIRGHVSTCLGRVVQQGVLLWGAQPHAGRLHACATLPTPPQAPAAAAAVGHTQVFLHPEPPPLLTVRAVADVVTFEPTPGDVICE